MLGLDVPVATPEGWTQVADLRVGDQTFDRHGRMCVVRAASEPFRDKRCLVVRTPQDEAVVVSSDHEWPVRSRLGGDMKRRTPTRQLVHSAPGPWRQINVTTEGLDLPTRALPLNPYVLGVWLGCGRTTGVTLAFSDRRVADRIARTGMPCRPLTPEGSGKWTLAEADYARGQPCRARVALIRAGVWGEKVIPLPYQRGSREQRMALLQGLIDVDAHVPESGNIVFSSKNRELVVQFRDLLFSVGGKGAVRSRVHPKQGEFWSVNFTMENAASLPEKAERCHASRDAGSRTIWAEGTPVTHVRRIGVDSPDGSLLVGRTLLPTYSG